MRECDSYRRTRSNVPVSEMPTCRQLTANVEEEPYGAEIAFEYATIRDCQTGSERGEAVDEILCFCLGGDSKLTAFLLL